MKFKVSKEEVRKIFKGYFWHFADLPDFTELEGEVVERPMTVGEREIAAGLDKAFEESLPQLPELKIWDDDLEIETQNKHIFLRDLILYLKAKENQ